MESFCFIYNPAANRNKAKEELEALRLQLDKWGGAYLLQSAKHGQIRELAREAADKVDAVIACGGDGTVRDVASGLIQANTDTAMGILPLGSGNDFSKSLSLSKNFRDALATIKRGQLRRIDVGQCNDFYFINTLGFGFDGLTNRYAAQSQISSGTLRYIISALKANVKRHNFEADISIDEVPAEESPFVMFTAANGRIEGGNFVVAPGARVDDGELDFLTVRPVSRLVLPTLLPFFLMGKQHLLPHVKLQRGRKAVIRINQKVAIHADGEMINTSATEFKIKVLPKVLSVIA